MDRLYGTEKADKNMFLKDKVLKLLNVYIFEGREVIHSEEYKEKLERFMSL